MDDKIEKVSEDLYADTDFEDDEELNNSYFIGIEPKNIKIIEKKEEKTSQFYDGSNKLLAEKIIEKKSGKIIEIKYDPMGFKVSYIEKDKNKRLTKSIKYYENGQQKMVTDYGKNGDYKSLAFNVDGSRQSYVEKHKDGTADAIYYDADGKGNNVVVKMDSNKEVLEKRVVKG